MAQPCIIYLRVISLDRLRCAHITKEIPCRMIRQGCTISLAPPQFRLFLPKQGTPSINAPARLKKSLGGGVLCERRVSLGFECPGDAQFASYDNYFHGESWVWMGSTMQAFSESRTLWKQPAAVELSLSVPGLGPWRGDMQPFADEASLRATGACEHRLNSVALELLLLN